ncbi:MAG TPA: ABC transporter substrate-binding protein [Thermodesulfobacteriota bacterium]
MRGPRRLALRTLGACLLAVPALALAGLGSAAGETPAPVTVAAILDLTGPGAALGAAERIGLALAEREVAARGGLGGRPLRLVVFDSATSTRAAERAARIAIEDERALVLVGGSTRGPASALAAAAQRAEVPLIALAEGRGGEGGAAPRWVFQAPPGTARLADVLAGDLARRGLLRVGFLEAASPIGAAGRAAFEAAARRRGLALAHREVVADETGDLAAIVAAVLDAKPQAVVVWAIPPLAGAIAQPLLDLAPGLPHYQSHAALASAFLPLAGAAAAGVRTAVPRVMVAEALPEADPDRSRLVAFVREVRAAGGPGSSPFPGYGYDALGLAAAAIEQASSGWGGDEPAARRRLDVRDALEAMPDYRGVTGVYRYRPDDHGGLDERALVIVEAVVPPGGKVATWRPVATGR